MCLGAIFHSRVGSVYFGAADAKTGACGSVLDLPGEHRINHHCQVHGGVLQSQCAQHLSDYFARLRADKRLHRVPVREDALRLPAGALAGYMQGVQAIPLDAFEAAQGLRVQVWQNMLAPQRPERLVLCLHGASSWSCIYQALLTAPLDDATVVCALDLPGHGGSDKTKKGQEFNSAFQLHVLDAFVYKSSAPHIHLVAQDTGCELAMHLAARHPGRIDALTLYNPLRLDRGHLLHQGASVRSRAQFIDSLHRQCVGDMAAVAALSAPYPDAGHIAGVLRQCCERTALPATASFASVTPHVVAHVSEAFFDESHRFESKFGLTFERQDHHASGTYPGLGRAIF